MCFHVCAVTGSLYNEIIGKTRKFIPGLVHIKARRMRIPDWRKLSFNPDVLLEPVPDDGRLVLWLAGERDHGFQYWERIGTVARAAVVVDQGLCMIAATSIRARQRARGLLGNLWQRFREAAGEVWTLPTGEAAEQCGERQTDLVLAWSDDEAAPLEEARLRRHWPEGRRFQQIAPDLFVVAGVQPPPTETALETALGCPRAQGEQLLAAARQAGNRRAEATALTDLGIMAMSQGDAPQAIAHLQAALEIARQLGDRARESDVLGNLGLAALASSHPASARELFTHELTLAREAGDRFAEKLALERLGLTYAALRDHTRAFAYFDQALTLARALGDRQHEANLIWHQSVQYAELGQRDAAIMKAQSAIDLLQKMGKPQAELFTNHLRSYRLSEAGGTQDPGLAAAVPYGGAVTVGALMGYNPQPESAQAASGPGLLRMALSAARAMTTFFGAGFKTVPAAIQQKRLQTCATCEHHTGLRCRVCGCFTNIKTRLPHEECPIGKWPAGTSPVPKS